MWTAEARQRYGLTRRKNGLRLTDPEWALLEPLLPQHTSMGTLKAYAALDPGCDTSRIANGLRLGRVARMGAAAAPCTKWFRHLARLQLVRKASSRAAYGQEQICTDRFQEELGSLGARRMCLEPEPALARPVKHAC